MHISRTIALSLATLTLATGTAIAAPAAAYADTVPGAGTSTTSSTSQPDDSIESAGAWRITVKRATYPTLQSERDRLMHDAERAGFATSIECAVAGDLTSCSSDSFVVTGAPYRSVLTTFRYDPAVVAIDAAHR